MYAGPPLIVAGFMIAFFGAHLQGANRAALVLAGFLWLALVMGAVWWADQSTEARALTERDDRGGR